MRVLYVEDERYLAEATIYLLKKSGIDVDWAQDGENGLKYATHGTYACIILDVMLPKLSGLEILQSLRRAGNSTPIIMLSALSEVEDKVRALGFGADDYLAKPFKVAELIARLKALVRRPPLQPTTKIKFADLVYDQDSRTLNQLTLTAKEALIFELLIKNPEKIYPKTTLLAHAWGYTEVHDEKYVEVYISYLRQKLRQLKSSAKIVASRNLGYKLTAGENPHV